MFLLVADDLTGGNDAGIQFAKHGLEARLALDSDAATVSGCLGATPPDMLIVNTNTRNISGEEAAKRVAEMASSLRDRAPEIVFKKIDSTLRGNPGAEMEALMRGFGFSAAFLAPAYPKQGRTVKNGHLLVDGTPVHQTGFANDPLAPIRQSSVAGIMREQSDRKAAMVSASVLDGPLENVTAHINGLLREGAELLVFDAETAAHLTAVATVGFALRQRPLFIGSAGLAEALAALPQQSAPSKEHHALAPTERVLFVCGSAHQMTHAQTALLAAENVPVVRVPETVLDASAPESIRRETVEKTRSALTGGNAVLATPLGRIGTAGSVAEGMALSEELAAIAVETVREFRHDPASTALVMTGGETAYAVLAQLGACLDLHDELHPGIALCTVASGPWKGLKAVTKAGGFGTEKTLVELLHMLRPQTAAQG